MKPEILRGIANQGAWPLPACPALEVFQRMTIAARLVARVQTATRLRRSIFVARTKSKPRPRSTVALAKMHAIMKEIEGPGVIALTAAQPRLHD